MIDYKKKIAEILCSHVTDLTAEEIEEIVEVPQDKSNGDYAFPCFRLAKVLRKAPPLIAKDIAEGIKDDPLFEKVEQVNAYVNMFIDAEEYLKDTLKEALDSENFGKSDEGNGKVITIDFSSPNIAKPFHIGHIRSTVIGNSINLIYRNLGYEVVRLNHVGDYGTQFGKMIVAYRKWGNEDEVKANPIETLLGLYTKFHQEADKDPELEDEARKAFVKLEAGEEEEVRLWKWFSDESLREFNRVYDMLEIEFDEIDGESFYTDKMQRFIDELNAKNLMHESRGANIVDLEEWDMPPALITKSDGSTLYITRDIATAVYRDEHYHFYKNIYVVATQQNLYFQQLWKVLELLGYDCYKDCVHVPFGMVSMESGTMSTRSGRVIFLEDVLNKAVDQTREIIAEKNPNADPEFIDKVAHEVGIGAVIFQELSNNKIKDYVFKWDKVLNFDGETGPYVQYTHARCCSVMRKAGEEVCAKAQSGEIDYSKITGKNAFELGRLLHDMPDVIHEAADKYEPSIITRHVVNIAQAYNRFYHDEHILTENEDEKIAKVALTIAAKNGIKNGLALLGMHAPERM